MKKIYHKTKEFFKSHISIFIVFVLIFMFMFAYLFHNIVITIHSGEAGVLYKRFFGGTVVDRVYAEGIHFIYPWDTLYVYNVRVQEVFHEFDVLTKNGLKVHLIISIRYYPEYNLLGVLHKKVGPDYRNKVVVPEIEAVLRIIIGQINAEEAYTTKTSLIQESINVAIEQVAQRFVKVDDVIIKRIILPSAVQSSIEYKIKQKHLAEAHEYKIEREKKEAERKRIEAEAFKRYNDILNTSLSDRILQWEGIRASLELSKSNNTKVVVIGSGKRGLPIFGNLILDEPSATGYQATPAKPAAPDETDARETDAKPAAPGETGTQETTAKPDAPGETGIAADASGETGLTEDTTNRQ
ncbi:MAG: prohibitin family protein [Desulfobacterales bacterium]|nr:prohibitin family protein [Desulfobacterales bacterium]